jgi:hypothetical protein
MRQPDTREQDRKPGRSFDDPEKPMGEGILARSTTGGHAPAEDFRPRDEQAAASDNAVADRAKVIGVLRKAEELIAEENLPKGQETPRRALELACGRVGLTVEEYDALVKKDPELLALEQKVIAGARAKLG